MEIEVDQSVKIEDTAGDTVLAFSNDVQRAIVIPAAVKREALTCGSVESHVRSLC